METGYVKDEHSQILRQFFFGMNGIWETGTMEPFETNLTYLFYKQLQFIIIGDKLTYYTNSNLQGVS